MNATPRAHSRWRAAVAACALLGTLASCAPVAHAPVAPLEVAALAARYEKQRVARETRLVAARLETTVWIEGGALGRLPGLPMDVALIGPDRVRARVASLFGTGIDLVVLGDSMAAYVPPRRVGVELASLEDSLGIRRPGEWACRTLAASWKPPGSNWVALPGDSLRYIAWLEGGDSLALASGAQGLPARIEIRSAGGRSLNLRYTAWKWIDGVAWPERLEIADGAGTFQVALRVDRARFERQGDPLWMKLVIPASAARLDWPALKDMVAKIGGGG